MVRNKNVLFQCHFKWVDNKVFIYAEKIVDHQLFNFDFDCAGVGALRTLYGRLFFRSSAIRIEKFAFLLSKRKRRKTSFLYCAPAVLYLVLKWRERFKGGHSGRLRVCRPSYRHLVTCRDPMRGDLTTMDDFCTTGAHITIVPYASKGRTSHQYSINPAKVSFSCFTKVPTF